MAVDELIDKPFMIHGQSRIVSGEHVALMEFASRLGSFSSTQDSSIGDQGNTREEAQLLMSLLVCPLKFDLEDMEPVSASDSDPSYTSDSSYSRRETFTFTCPSFSLDQGSEAFSATSVPRSTIRKCSRTHRSSAPLSSEQLMPEALLGRPLKVDDRGALRLSADAMVRNILQSFQKAIDWRTQAWITSLSKVLARKEEQISNSKDLDGDWTTLLSTSEACLLVQLQQIAGKIAVLSGSTKFEVLPHRFNSQDYICDVGSKRQKTGTGATDFEECNYSYAVVHSLACDCTVNLETPAGYSEITIQVPGIIEGTFLSGLSSMEELTSVAIEIDTKMLAAMIERATRKVVRASVEVGLEAAAAAATVQVTQQESDDVIEEGVGTPSEGFVERTYNTPLRDFSPIQTEAFAAIVTPRSVFSPNSMHHRDDARRDSVYLPIPEDLDSAAGSLPRRISPQPRSSPSFAPRTATSCKSSGLALVSPAPHESYEFHEVSDSSPSLPMLVEVACRAMHSK